MEAYARVGTPLLVRVQEKTKAQPWKAVAYATVNILTFSRLLFLYVAWGAIDAGGAWLAFLMVLAAGLSDTLDGALARALRASSRFGEFADQLIDKIFFLPLLFVTPHIPVATALSFLLLEGSLVVYRVAVLIVTHKAHVGANVFGKTKHWFELCGLGAVLLALSLEGTAPWWLILDLTDFGTDILFLGGLYFAALSVAGQLRTHHRHVVSIVISR